MKTTRPSSPRARPHDRAHDQAKLAALWRLAPNWLAKVWAKHIGRKDPEPPDAAPDVPGKG
jgi:hypothetical protein